MNAKRAITLTSGLLLAAALVYGVYWFVTGWQQLSMRLSGPGRNVAPSTSMELYEINLRRMEVDEKGKETGKVLEWKLAIPRAYLVDESGENGAVYNSKDWDGTHYGFSLEMLISDDFRNVVPATQLPELNKKKVMSVIGTGNNVAGSSKYIVENDLCVSADDESKISKKYGREYGLFPCAGRGKHTARCRVGMQLDGWSIGAGVWEDTLYKQPEKVCEFTKAFLNKYTIKRDNAQVKKPGSTP